jgi:hypothetical protein
MRKVTLILAAALTLAVLSRLPAGPVAAAGAINPLELMRQATDLPVQAIEDFSMIY